VVRDAGWLVRGAGEGHMGENRESNPGAARGAAKSAQYVFNPLVRMPGSYARPEPLVEWLVVGGWWAVVSGWRGGRSFAPAGALRLGNGVRPTAAPAGRLAVG
jgi:hypothetical protein